MYHLDILIITNKTRHKACVFQLFERQVRTVHACMHVCTHNIHTHDLDIACKNVLIIHNSMMLAALVTL